MIEEGTYGRQAVTDKNAILQEVDEIPEDFLGELRDFIRFLKQKASRGRLEVTVMSESSLGKDWLRPEEDEAWGNL